MNRTSYYDVKTAHGSEVFQNDCSYDCYILLIFSSLVVDVNFISADMYILSSQYGNKNQRWHFPFKRWHTPKLSYTWKSKVWVSHGTVAFLDDNFYILCGPDCYLTIFYINCMLSRPSCGIKLLLLHAADLMWPIQIYDYAEIWPGYFPQNQLLTGMVLVIGTMKCWVRFSKLEMTS